MNDEFDRLGSFFGAAQRLQADMDAVGVGKPAHPVTNKAASLLSLLVYAYHPVWDEIGSYKCAYCGAVIRSSDDIDRPSFHLESCVWIQARKWLQSLPEGGPTP